MKNKLRLLSAVKCKLFTNQSGQVLIALVLTLLTILTVGLIIIQRSTVDVTTSTQNDQASRAFSAAEAGVEQALQGGSAITPQDLTNNSSYYVSASARLPLPNQALEYESTRKGEPTQFWLVDPFTDFGTNNPVAYYQRDGIYVYFGDKNAEKTATSNTLPALEISLIYFNTTDKKILAARTYVDTDSTRADNTRFYKCINSDYNILLDPPMINTSSSPNGTAEIDRSFKCRVRISTLYTGANIIPIMIRTRLLYVDFQPVAVGPEGFGAIGYSLPAQQTIFTSIGTSGQARKTIQVKKEDNVVPNFFDYAIYSAADIVKN